MKKSRTVYHLIVDKSGSMMDCIADTINGFNEQVNQIKQKVEAYPEEEIFMGLTVFNDHVKHLLTNVSPTTVNTLTYEVYRPEGSTALLDAIGLTIKELEYGISAINDQIPTRYLVIILTDGYENCSKIYNLDLIRSLILKLEKSGNWTFSFIGATLDAVDVAESLNIKKQNSLCFQKSEMNEKVWNRLQLSMDKYFSKKQKGQNTDNLFEEE